MSPNEVAYELAKCHQVRDRQTLTENLVAAEEGLRSDTTSEVEVRHLARLQQTAYGQLVRDHPEWQRDVLAEVEGEIRSAVEKNLEAGNELFRLTPAGESLPKDWVIIEPLAEDELLDLYKEAQEETGIPWYFLAAINLVESRMGRIDGRSPAGARGPMQFTEATWEEWGEDGDIRDPAAAIPAAARFLRGHGAPDQMARALRAYNPTQRYVTAVTNYAEVMEEDERAFVGYYNWQVFNRTKERVALLYVGWPDPIEEETRLDLCGD